MNSSELEKRMRELLEEQEYAPRETAWNQLKQELHPSSAAPKALFLFPAWKAAAAVALVLATTFTVYVLRQDRQPATPAIARTATVRPAAPAMLTAPEEKNKQAQPKTSKIAPPALATAQRSKPAKAAATPLIDAPVAAVPKREQLPQQPEVLPETKQTPAASGTVAQTAGRNTKTNISQPFPVYDMAANKPREDRLKLGIAANVGKPSLGDFQYNVGVVARRQLGDKFFAEATVALASTQVNYSERITSEPDKTGTVGNGDGGFHGASTSTDARYVNNILAIGVAPAIGIKATSDLSVSIGGDLYKSLNRTLALQQDRSKLNSEGYSDVPADKNVTDWDAGIKAQLDYRVWRKLSLNMQYRQGLTPFILVDGKSITNSAFNLGLKYYIGR